MHPIYLLLSHSSLLTSCTIFFNYFFLIKSSKKYSHFHILSQKTNLFSIAALISSSILYCSKYLAMLAWINLAVLIILHCFAFVNFLPVKYKGWSNTGFYVCITIWYGTILGIFIYRSF